MISFDEFKEKAEIVITIQIDCGDERILDTTETGNGSDLEGVINEAIATLGKAERRYLPYSLQKQYESEYPEEDEDEEATTDN